MGRAGPAIARARGAHRPVSRPRRGAVLAGSAAVAWPWPSSPAPGRHLPRRARRPPSARRSPPVPDLQLPRNTEKPVRTLMYKLLPGMLR
jgi:hypothetical protein